MKILNANCLHSGDWVVAAPQFREELKQKGQIVNQFPRNHNGAWMWTQSLRELGHEVVEFDYRFSPILKKKWQAKYPTLNWIHERVWKNTNFITSFERELINKQLLNTAKAVKPDIFMTYPGERIYPETIEHMSRKLNIRTVLWLGRDVVHERTPNVVESFPYYDFVFTIDPPAIEKYRRHGAKHVFYLPLGCYPPTHKKIDLSVEDKSKYSAPVSFVGQLFDDRPEFLCELASPDVNFWTHWWNQDMQQKYPQLSPLYRGQARGEAMIKVLNGADIVLNVHRATNSYEGTNMRTFEAAGCAAFQLTEYKNEIGHMFKIGEEIEVYHDIDDLKKKIEYYLKHPDERSDMAKNAQRRVYAEHTYHQRFEEMIAIIMQYG